MLETVEDDRSICARNIARNFKKCSLDLHSIIARKLCSARSGFARHFGALEKFLLELARLENCKEEFLLGTRSARKLTCSFCSNSKNFRSVSALCATSSQNCLYTSFSCECKHVENYIHFLWKRELVLRPSENFSSSSKTSK